MELFFQLRKTMALFFASAMVFSVQQQIEANSQQSPVNFEFKGGKIIEINLVDPTFDGHDEAVTFKISGHHGHRSLKVVSKNVPALTVENEEYELKQFHFHAPAEHKFDDVEHALEVHFVHEKEIEPGAQYPKRAVVGLLFKVGAHNEAIQEVIDLANAGEDAEHKLVPANILFSSDSRALRYLGSLTTPPYTQGVSWVVFRGIAQISQEQLNELKRLDLSHTSRPAQPLTDSAVVADSYLDK
ncbi:carbonic anhydrase family protein [Candidatus Dependentiae bacterium]|nr:carbonic anhydrase family protein [Candidatus Dependentiae bacterium]